MRALASAHETAPIQKRKRNKNADRARQPQGKKLVGERKLVGRSGRPVWTNWRHETKTNVGLAGEETENYARLKITKKAFKPRYNVMLVKTQNYVI